MVVLWLPRTAIVRFKMQSWSSYFVRCIRNRRRFKEIQTANFTHNWIPTAKVTGRFNSDSVRYRNFIRNSRRRDPRAFGHLVSFVRLAVGAFRKLSRGGKGRSWGGEDGDDVLEFTWWRARLRHRRPLFLPDILATPVLRIHERFRFFALNLKALRILYLPVS